MPGNTYIFDVSDSSNATHPLYISTADHTASQSFDVANTLGTAEGVVRSTQTEGTAYAKVTFTVPSDATDTDLWYVCGNHANMGGESDIAVPRTGTVTLIDLIGVEYDAPVGSEAAGSLTLTARAGSFTQSHETGFDVTGLTYNIDGTTAYHLVPADIATKVVSTDGTSLQLNLAPSNGLEAHTNAANLLDGSGSPADTVTAASVGGITDTTSAITVTAAAAPAATAIGGVDFDTGTNTLTVVGAAGGIFDSTTTADVTAISITLHDGTAVTIANTDLDGSVRANNAGGLDIPLGSAFAHISALSDADADTISISDAFISGVSAATSLTINTTDSTARPATDIVITGVEYLAASGGSAAELTLIANSGGFDTTFASGFDPSGIGYLIDGVGTAYALASSDISTATASTDGRELKLVLTASNGLSTHANNANLLDGGGSATDTVTTSSVAGIADTTVAIDVAAAAAPRPSDVVITSVEFHAGAGMLTLKAAAGSFDDAFATNLAANYSSGFSYLIDGARANEVAIAPSDISSISASNSSGSVSALNILLTPGNNSLVNHTNAANLLDGNSSGADSFTTSSVPGFVDSVGDTVLASSGGSGGGSGGSGGSSGGSGITIGGVDFDPGTEKLLIVPDAGSSFPASTAKSDLDFAHMEISINGGGIAPLTNANVDSISVNSQGAIEVTLAASYTTANKANLGDGTDDLVMFGTGFYSGVNATTSPLTIVVSSGGGPQMHYPANSTEYTGSIFDTLGTETWAGSTVTPPATYRTDLSGDGVTSNTLDARQEQLVADIVGALVDELKEFKDGGNVVPGTPSTTENHPLFIVTDQAAGATVDEVILVEDGYIVHLKGQFDTDDTATAPTAQITGAVTALAAYVDVSDSTTIPTPDTSAIIDVDLTSATITFEGIIQNDIV